MCDKCGKTVETNAADERIASKAVEREGWECQGYLTYSGAYHKPRYVNLCPKCSKIERSIAPIETELNNFATFAETE